MTVPEYNLDTETLDHLRPGQSRALECAKVLAALPDHIAQLGEQPLKAVLVIVVPENSDADTIGCIAGDWRSIRAHFKKVEASLR